VSSIRSALVLALLLGGCHSGTNPRPDADPEPEPDAYQPPPRADVCYPESNKCSQRDPEGRCVPVRSVCYYYSVSYCPAGSFIGATCPEPDAGQDSGPDAATDAAAGCPACSGDFICVIPAAGFGPPTCQHLPDECNPDRSLDAAPATCTPCVGTAFCHSPSHCVDGSAAVYCDP
jgi:hypothetical protein